MIISNCIKIFISSLLFFFILNKTSIAENARLVIASSTSVNDTGLLPFLGKEFEKNYNIKVHILSLGTGQALEVARKGNVDILLIHHTPSEEKFVKNGFGIKRYNLMYNDYILVGPKNTNIECKDLNTTMKHIKKNNLPFISRADSSGTNLKEIELWDSLDLDYKKFTKWYKKIGQGMGQTLMIANQIKAFTLSDRSTWTSFNNKENLKIICQNYPPLINQYGIINVNPKINKNINKKYSEIFINWITSEIGKKLINNFNVKDQQLFTYNFK